VFGVRVLVDVDLRRTLRLTRREKKARLFLPLEVAGDLEAFRQEIYAEFPVMGIPHELVVKVRGATDADEEASYVALRSDDDLRRAYDMAKAAGQGLQVGQQREEVEYGMRAWLCLCVGVYGAVPSE
jgi:hypothetical protein